VEEPTAFLADNSPPIKPLPPQWVGESSETEMAPEVHLFTVSSGKVPDKRFKEGSTPNAQVVLAPQVDSSSYFLVKISHHKCAQGSEDSLNLEDAPSKAYEEIAELRRRVLELETQAAELFKSNLPRGKLFKCHYNQILTPINKSQTWVTFVGTFQAL
jgi:hypothetical protein